MTRLTRKALAGLIGLLTTGCARDAAPPWLVNESASLPQGLYRRTAEPPVRGAIVALRPSGPARAYLEVLGAGPGARLLKRVAAVGGDAACRQGAWLTWPGGAARALDQDRRGHALPRWAGCVRLAAGEILVIGDTPLSFDSRYLGPVRVSDIEGTYREAWRW